MPEMELSALHGNHFVINYCFEKSHGRTVGETSQNVPRMNRDNHNITVPRMDQL